MKNTSDTQKILSAIGGLGDRIGGLTQCVDGLDDRMDRFEGRMDRLEKNQQEMRSELSKEMHGGFMELGEAIQELADHMDRRFDENGECMMGLLRLSDRKTNELIYALAKKKIFTRIEANALAASGPAL